MSYFDWTEPRIETLKRMWKDGKSARVIAVELHTTRNAVVGKAMRLKLPKRVTMVGHRGAISTAPKRVAAMAKKELPPSRAPSVNFVKGVRLTRSELEEQLRQAAVNTGGSIK